MANEDNGCENTTSTIHLMVQNESFELSSSLFSQLVGYSSSSDLTRSTLDKQRQIYLNVDPRIFNAYLLYIQSDWFVRPDCLSQEDLINGLRICGAPLALIHYYERCDLISFLSSHQYSSYPINKETRIRQIWLNALILIGLIIATCVLTIDLYRQMLILNKNPYEEMSQLLIILIYLIDGVLFLYSCVHGILKFVSDTDQGKRLEKDPDFIADIISCLGKQFK
jgi:hypothetical protein